jgi:hypothetical protein
MKDFLFLIICLGTFGLTVLPFIQSFDKSKTWVKFSIAFILFSITGVVTLWREKIIDQEEETKDSLNQVQLVERDRLNNLQLKQRDSVNRENLIALADLFSQKLIQQGQQIDKAVPFISPFNIKTVKEGLKITYTIYKPIERLKLTIVPNIFEDQFDPSFGTDVVNLPKRIGKNVIVIPPEKIPFGKWAKFQISSVNPHLQSMVFDHFNFATSSTGQILITADIDFIAADNDQILISDDSVSVEKLKH